MFSLVQFDNGEYCVLPTKRVKRVHGSNCIVKYIGGAKYNANILEQRGKIFISCRMIPDLFINLDIDVGYRNVSFFLLKFFSHINYFLSALIVN